MKRDNGYLIGNKFAVGASPNKTAFRKGNKPWNKNKKGIHLSEKSEFKKGQKGNKWLPLMTMRIRVQRGVSRQYIKVGEPNDWIEYAKYLWQEKYGFVIKGDIIHHIDGNQMNDIIENLIALPRADHPIFHSRWGLRQFTNEQIAFYVGRYTKQ